MEIDEKNNQIKFDLTDSRTGEKIVMPIGCEKCASKNITDHDEFGLPLGRRFWCHDCDNTFGRLGEAYGRQS